MWQSIYFILLPLQINLNPRQYLNIIGVQEMLDNEKDDDCGPTLSMGLLG